MRIVVDSGRIADMDKKAIEVFGIPGEVLMGHAGKAVFDRLCALYPGYTPVIIAGKGNNGGDGLVLAHFFLNNGFRPHLFLLWPPEQFSRTSALYWRILQNQGFPYHLIGEEGHLTGFVDRILSQERKGLLLIDALFGTGLDKPLSGRFAHIAAEWNGIADAVKVAIDIPSGINGSGIVLGESFFRCDRTYTMGLEKIGLYMEPGRSAAGRIEVIDIGFPRQAVPDTDIGYLLEDSDFFCGCRFLPPPLPSAAHKYHRRVAVLFAGSPGMDGAALLAARTAFLGGAGLVRIYTHPDSASVLAGRYPEIQVKALPEPSIRKTMEEISGDHRIGSVVIGPGIGRASWAVQLVQASLDILRKRRRQGDTEAGATSAWIFDADACVLAGKLGSVAMPNGNPVPICTPHAGEWRAMFSEYVASMDYAATDKLRLIRELSRQSGWIIVAKGSDTVVADPQGSFFINPTGNPVLAKGGSGDILGGLLAGLIAGKVDPLRAAAAAAFILGRAADRILSRKGPYIQGAEFLLPEMTALLADYGLRSSAARPMQS